MRIVAGAFALVLAALVVGSASSAARPRPHLALVPTSPGRLAAILSDADPRNLDLTQLVPRAGRINHVWFIPAGTGHAQIAVAWQQGTLRRTRTDAYEDSRRYYLALWNPQPTSLAWQKRWVPHVLVRRSPFPIANWWGASAVRLADVTGDGHDDLLITMGCSDCNHGASAISVVATFGRHVRRIYGQQRDAFTDERGVPVRGAPITETFWGAHNGTLWIDYPYNTPAGKREIVLLRWQGNRGWRTVSSRALTGDQLRRVFPWLNETQGGR